MAIAPDRAGTGTNGLALRPPGAIAFRFGPAASPRTSPRRSGPASRSPPSNRAGLAFDLDTPDGPGPLARARRRGVISLGHRARRDPRGRAGRRPGGAHRGGAAPPPASGWPMRRPGRDPEGRLQGRGSAGRAGIGRAAAVARDWADALGQGRAPGGAGAARVRRGRAHGRRRADHLPHPPRPRVRERRRRPLERRRRRTSRRCCRSTPTRRRDALRDAARRAAPARAPAIVISDSFGRPWRNGIVNVAIGAAGIEVLLDLRGTPDAARSGDARHGHRRGR